MWSIYRKELNTFFSSLIGYIAMAVFLVITGLFVWVFPDTSVLEYGFATLDTFFTTAPFILMFLIPAVTMRSFAEEISLGTIELLVTRPITDRQIIFGKYFAALTLVVVSILPTAIYYYSVYMLGAPAGNLDSGAILGSYIGLVLLGAVFVAIGVFASSLTSNQIVAFVLAISLCFLFYMAFDYISRLPVFYGSIDDIVQQIGINAHYESISRGVVDTRDLTYFFSVTAIFLVMTQTSLSSRRQ